MAFTRSALVTAAATIGAAALLPATSAFGANAVPFDLFTGTEHTKGNGHAYGTVEFDTRKTAYVQGWINDICPKDGDGIYLEIWTTYGPKGFIGGRFQTERMVKDVSTCKTDGHAFAFRTKTRGNKRINGVHFRIRECDYVPNSGYTDNLNCNGDMSTFDIDRDRR